MRKLVNAHVLVCKHRNDVHLYLATRLELSYCLTYTGPRTTSTHTYYDSSFSSHGCILYYTYAKYYRYYDLATSLVIL